MTSKPAAARDPLRTRARILRVATDEFASKGYSGARTQTIARRASCSIRMLYHYFGNKGALYIYVLEHALGQLRKEELQLDFDACSPLQGIVQMFDFIDRHFGARPELRSLLAYENLNHARHLAQSSQIREMASPVITLIAKLLGRGAADGTFRADIEPLHLYVSMVSLSYYSKAHAPTLSRIFGRDLNSAAWQASHRAHSERMLISFLMAHESVASAAVPAASTTPPVKTGAGHRRSGARAPARAAG